MTDVAILAENGRTLRISHVAAGADHGWTYSVDLELESARGGVGVYDYGDPRLPGFFAELAADWQGFEGEREFLSLEGQLTITARHDGRGTVNCVVTLRQPWPPGWSLEAELDLGAGAHLESISSDLASVFAQAESERPASRASRRWQRIQLAGGRGQHPSSFGPCAGRCVGDGP